VLVADFNGDGRDDIFLPAHNETPDIAMPSTAYLSSPTGKFTKITLNDHVTAHGGALEYIDGVPTVFTSTFGPSINNLGDWDPSYVFVNGAFVQRTNQYVGGDTAAVAAFGASGQYEMILADVWYGSISQTGPTGKGDINVYGFNGTLPTTDVEHPIQSIIPYLSTLPEYQSRLSFMGPGITHVFRVWHDDLNHDGKEDVLAGQSMWSSSSNDWPTALQVLINRGDGTFEDATQNLNPEMGLNTDELDYNPTFIDLDNSGINSYLFGSYSFTGSTRNANYLLINDGTGHLHIALHDQFNQLSQQAWNYVRQQYNGLNGYSVAEYSSSSVVPKFIGIPQADGSINYAAELPIYKQVGSYLQVSYAFVNIPLNYNPNIDYTTSTVISDRNNSTLLRTWAGNDTFYDTNANTTGHIDGGLGINTSTYSHNASTYQITHNNDGSYVVAGNGLTDTLVNIERLQFADQTIWIGPVDTVAPTVTQDSPTDDSTGAAIASNIVLTFSEAIARGTGNIVLKNAADTIIATYDAATSSNLTISGSTLTINPTADLSYSTGYKVEFANGSIKDIAGNSYAGTTAYNFTTVAAPDLTPPAAPKLITNTGFNFLVDPQITLQTSLGTVILELNPEQAPITTANMLAYANNGFYDLTLFHRVISGFMVQGGGFNTGLNYKTPTYSAISLESNNGLSNLRGTIAMARTSVADSATTQFFINQVDNTFLNYSSAASPGYAVFGKVLSGLSVIDSIAHVPTTTIGPYANVPVTDVTITSLRQTLAGSSITNAGTLTVSDLETGAQWLYSLDGAVTWTAGTGNSFTVPAGNYAAGVIQVKQIDIAGNVSTSNGMLTSALVVDTTVPTVTTFGPTAGVAIGSNVLVAFSEAIQLGTGSIVLKNAAGTVIETFNAATSSNLTISGSTLTINPTADLAYSTGYKVEFAAGSVKDIAGNSYAGTTSYNFTTVAPSGSNQTGTTGNDSFTSTTGNDTIDGGAGTDTATFSNNLSAYTLTRTGSTYTVHANSGTDGTDTLTNIESLHFADKTVNLTIQALAAAAPQADVTRLTELYVAFFNRVPDADGLAFWIGRMGAGQGINQIADSFYEAGVYQSSLTGYTSTMSHSDFVNVVYRNVLGRSKGADAGGLAYWSGRLETQTATHGSLVSTILDSAHTFKGDATWGWVADLLDNKITVAKTFAVDWGLNYNTPSDSISHGMAIAAAVTPTSTTAAITLIGVSASEMHLG
jgi:cyclophilin family peptidyl-prolyl cis-trans isomerase/methionine-rich copper-binding protein CopC